MKTGNKIILAVIFFIQVNNSKLFSQSIPHLQKKGTTQELIVDGKPFLVLGGELGNSSASSMDYMQAFWPRFQALHLNTILSPVYWDLLEPIEWKFDFSLVDSMIKKSEENHLKLILLWFGSWKNSMSCYAPEWIKTNQKRFPRAEDRSGRRLEILSAFNKNNLDADVKAFSSLMRHIKEKDISHTVIMVQVENEIGIIT